MGKYLERKRFDEIDIDDPFFDSLKNDYKEFGNWFQRKNDQIAYVHYNESKQLDGFLFFKVESGIVDDVEPKIQGKTIIKIGTFKINPHGTRLGERFIKKVLDFAMEQKADKCYVTIFDKQKNLIDLLKKFGFYEYGIKKTQNGDERVLLKEMKTISSDIYLDYPLINIRENKKYLLAIYPKYHSKMFPDSILCNEDARILEDVSYTNSIHKNYVCRMYSAKRLKKGDIVVIYKTTSKEGRAEYDSVATSICVIEELRYQEEFKDFEDFYKYACRYSIFDKEDLQYWYNNGGCFVIKMLYNIALKKRITRHDLIEEIGLPRNEKYWGCFEITDTQLERIIKNGEVDESFIIN